MKSLAAGKGGGRINFLTGRGEGRGCCLGSSGALCKGERGGGEALWLLEGLETSLGSGVVPWGALAAPWLQPSPPPPPAALSPAPALSRNLAAVPCWQQTHFLPLPALHTPCFASCRPIGRGGPRGGGSTCVTGSSPPSSAAGGLPGCVGPVPWGAVAASRGASVGLGACWLCRCKGWALCPLPSRAMPLPSYLTLQGPRLSKTGLAGTMWDPDLSSPCHRTTPPSCSLCPAQPSPAVPLPPMSAWHRGCCPPGEVCCWSCALRASPWGLVLSAG